MGDWREVVRELLKGFDPVPPPPPRPTVGVFPDLYPEEAAQETPRAARGAWGDVHGHYVEPSQPSAEDLDDPEQEWIEVTTFGEAKSRYVRGRR